MIHLPILYVHNHPVDRCQPPKSIVFLLAQTTYSHSNITLLTKHPRHLHRYSVFGSRLAAQQALSAILPGPHSGQTLPNGSSPRKKMSNVGPNTKDDPASDSHMTCYASPGAIRVSQGAAEWCRRTKNGRCGTDGVRTRGVGLRTYCILATQHDPCPRTSSHT